MINLTLLFGLYLGIIIRNKIRAERFKILNNSELGKFYLLTIIFANINLILLSNIIKFFYIYNLNSRITYATNKAFRNHQNNLRCCNIFENILYL